LILRFQQNYFQISSKILDPLAKSIFSCRNNSLSTEIIKALEAVASQYPFPFSQLNFTQSNIQIKVDIISVKSDCTIEKERFVLMQARIWRHYRSVSKLGQSSSDPYVSHSWEIIDHACVQASTHTYNIQYTCTQLLAVRTQALTMNAGWWIA